MIKPISYGISDSVVPMGGLRGALENINEGVLSDPMLLKVILKPITVMITANNSDRNLKIWAKLIDFKILKNEILHCLDKQKIGITCSIFEKRCSNF